MTVPESITLEYLGLGVVKDPEAEVYYFSFAEINRTMSKLKLDSTTALNLVDALSKRIYELERQVLPRRH